MSIWWRRHGIGILGYIAGAIPGLLAIDDLITKAHQKYWLAAGVLTGLAITRFSYTVQKPQGPPNA